MRKIVNIVAIAVAICMLITIGTASAETLNLTVDNDNVAAGPDCSKYDVGITYEGKNMTIVIWKPVDTDAHLKSIYLNFVTLNSVQNITLPDDTEIEFTYGGPAVPNLGTFNMNLTLGKDEYGNMVKPKIVQIEFADNIMLTPNLAGFSAAVHIGGLGIDGEGSKKLGNGECGGGGIDEEIPEFPTVALPIAAILGLAFFFQRRKE